MKLTRRQFLKTAAAAGAFVSIGGFQVFVPKRAYAFQQSPPVSKFSAGLIGLGLAGTGGANPYIPVLLPDTTTFPGCDTYTIAAGEYSEQLPGLPGPTKFWGYASLKPGEKLVNGNPDFQYLGGVIIAQRKRPVRLLVTNQLPNQHILPVDTTIPGAETGQAQNRIATHLHGGLVPWISDGGPFAWFTPTGPFGPDYLVSKVPDMLTLTPNGTLSYFYPNDQSARLVWYHDHALGITRLNAYAGIASAYLITDQFESDLISQKILPDIGFPYSLGVPLIIQDKGFNADGTLFYPSIYESDGTSQPVPTSMLITDVQGQYCTVVPPCGTGRWAYGPTEPTPATGVLTPMPNPSVVAEAFFDTILVNGAPYPTFGVAPRRYRFRILNGSQARFYNLQLYVSDGTADGITPTSSGNSSDVDPNGNPILRPTNPKGPAFIQIGTESGFLPAPVLFGDVNTNLNSNRTINWDPVTGNVNQYNLLLAPAERADVIIDFRGFGGQDLILYSDTPAPFPGGDIRNDYYPGAPDLRGIGGANGPTAGNSPDTRILMKFHVSTTGGIPGEKTLAQTYADLGNAAIGLPHVFAQSQPQPLLEASATRVRQLSLNEDFDEYGRLIQKLGTDVSIRQNNQGIDTWGRNLVDDPTEVTNVGDVEVWKIFNFTGDTHPIHFHLVNVQILGRAPITGTPGDFTSGAFVAADPNEHGWKETVRMNPVEVTKVIMKFDLPKVPFSVDPSTRTSINGTPVKGSEYVWHCHILEHEEHDMMRPLIVQGPYPLAVVPESQSAAKKSKATFEIVNGTPPYTITVADKQDAKKFPPVPATVGVIGGNTGTFTVDLKKGTSPDHDVIYKITDSAGVIVNATLTITKK